MKYTLKIALQILGICLVCVSCKQSGTEPDQKIFRPIAINPGGDIGHDLFYTTWPDTLEAPLDAGIHSLNFDGSGSAFLYRRVSLYSAPRDSVILFTALDTVSQYSWANGVYLGDLRGKTMRKVFSAEKYFYYVILSPDAQKILYSTYDSVYIYDIPSHIDHPIMAQSAYAEINYPVFSDDSKRILISGGDKQTGWGKELYLINTDGSNLTLIDTNRIYTGSYDWSPDGNKICYFGKSGDLLIREIANGAIDSLHNVKGTGPIRWSPKGNYIVYVIPVDDPASSQYKIVIFNTLTQRSVTCEMPSEDKYTNPHTFEWSADEKTLYAAIAGFPYYKEESTLLKIDPLTGTIIQNYYIRGIAFASLYRLKTIGEH